MKIGEVARRTGVGVETVRFYERRGLIAQPLKPSHGGFRSYPRETAERIRFIRQAQSLGFSLREIDELLALKTEPSTDCADVRDHALAKQRDVDDKIAQLENMRVALQTLIDACPGKGTVHFCSIIEAFESAKPADASFSESTESEIR